MSLQNASKMHVIKGVSKAWKNTRRGKNGYIPGPRNTGSYKCGDKGYCSQCPDNNYCKAGKPKHK